MTSKNDKRIPRLNLKKDFQSLVQFEYDYITPTIPMNVQKLEQDVKKAIERIDGLVNYYGKDIVELHQADKDLKVLLEDITSGRRWQDDRDRHEKDVQRIGRDLLYILDNYL